MQHCSFVAFSQHTKKYYANDNNYHDSKNYRASTIKRKMSKVFLRQFFSWLIFDSADKKKCGKIILYLTDNIRCVVGFRCQAITQVKQLFAGSVLGWVTAGPRPAHRNAEREVIFQRLLDWGQTVLNGRLYWHRFSAVSLCPRANAIQHRREWLRSHSHGG